MSGYLVDDTRKVTTQRLREMKKQGKKIAMLTSYDYTMGRLVDEAGIDAVLIGDSASNVMEGNPTTLPITLDEMIIYARSVARAVRRAFVVCDMPFGTYQVNSTEGVRNAIRIMQETGCDCVKLEGGEEVIETVKKILAAGIPVMGHLGLTPQIITKFGTFINDARMLDEAGCCAIVLEKIPARLAERVAKEVAAPVIGIGAGSGVDGQVLVVNDMLGMDQSFSPKFLRRYANLADVIHNAVGQYISDVKNVDFPGKDEAY